ncbi:MAG: LiaF transmembrane domain-containing protein [Anaerolineales bacterium]|jgi:uncharacterized integral membrane protein
MAENPPESQPTDRWEEREQRREARREVRRLRGQGGTWILGAILILLGIVFLLQNFGAAGINFSNWWALFILIPAFGAFERGAREVREAGGKLTGRARSAFLSGLILLFVTIFFLFNLDWVYVGPALLILAGLAFLANALLASRE